jgi:uncharacterized oxidoreductase
VLSTPPPEGARRPRGGPSDAVRIQAAVLIAWGSRLFESLGCDAREAGQVARGLVDANLAGHDSHGIGLVPQYVDNLVAGHVRAGRTPRVVVDRGSMLGLDGDRGFGQALGAAAMDMAIERARTDGCVVVGLANSHHLARIGQWGEQCARAGLASIHFVNVRSRPLVAPHGGLDARVSTNPFCVAVPDEPHPLVLDYATASIALGKTRVAVEAGERVAPGRLIDAHGAPTDDPSVMWNPPFGAILPFGEHKGWALSIMCEVLGGALAGGSVQDGATAHPMLNNMLSIVFDAAALCPPERRREEIAKLAAWVRGSPVAPGAPGVMLPGEPERRAAAERTRLGIPLAPATLAALEQCGAQAGVGSPRAGSA